MQYYFQFWNKIHHIVNNNSNMQEMYKHPFYLHHPLPIRFHKDVAYNFLIHHCGLHYKIVDYLLKRRLILSGYTIKHEPIIAFIQRIPATYYISQHLSTPDFKYRNSLNHDILLAKRQMPQQGTQDEEPVGVDYLFLSPMHYIYKDKKTHNQHHLLEINLLKGNRGFAEYNIINNSTFNIRIGQHPNKVIFTTNPIESLCYLQLHLNQHYHQQNTLIVSLLNSRQNITQVLKKNYMDNKKIKLFFLPSHQLNSQKAINRFISINQQRINTKVIYPNNYKSWHQMLQQQTFNNKYILFTDKTLNTKQNVHIINKALTKYLGEYSTQCFSLMLHVLAQSYKHKMAHNYEPLNTANIRIQSYKVIRQKLPKHSYHIINQYMNNVGYYYTPTQVDSWFQKMYINIYHKRNSMLHTSTFRYIDTLQYHTSKDMIHSLRKQGKQMLQMSMTNRHYNNHSHYQNSHDKSIHITKSKEIKNPNIHNKYQLKYDGNHTLYENR